MYSSGATGVFHDPWAVSCVDLGQNRVNYGYGVEAPKRSHASSQSTLYDWLIAEAVC